MEPRTYRVVVLGRLSERFASAFDGVSIEPGVGETVLTGKLDQAQLHGILDRLRDFGLELRGVEEITP